MYNMFCSPKGFGAGTTAQVAVIAVAGNIVIPDARLQSKLQGAAGDLGANVVIQQHLCSSATAKHMIRHQPGSQDCYNQHKHVLVCTPAADVAELACSCETGHRAVLHSAIMLAAVQ
jgi:hypothetical protein